MVTGSGRPLTIVDWQMWGQWIRYFPSHPRTNGCTGIRWCCEISNAIPIGTARLIFRLPAPAEIDVDFLGHANRCRPANQGIDRTDVARPSNLYRRQEMIFCKIIYGWLDPPSGIAGWLNRFHVHVACWRICMIWRISSRQLANTPFVPFGLFMYRSNNDARKHTGWTVHRSVNESSGKDRHSVPINQSRFDLLFVSASYQSRIVLVGPAFHPTYSDSLCRFHFNSAFLS